MIYKQINNLKKHIIKYLLILILAVSQVVLTQTTYADLISLQEEEEEEALTAVEELENTMNTSTGHNFDSIATHVPKEDIKHGIIHRSDESHYIWLETNDGKEHVFHMRKKSDSTFDLPRKVDYDKIPLKEHYGLARKAQEGLEKQALLQKHPVKNTEISRAFTQKLLDEINFNPNDYQIPRSYAEASHFLTGYPKSVGKHRSKVRDGYNNGLDHFAKKFLAEVDQIGLENVTPETARMYHHIRRELGRTFKDITGPLATANIYKRNEKKYGDKLGPTYKYLKEVKKLSHQEIAVNSFKSEGKDYNLKNTQGFEAFRKLEAKLKEFQKSNTQSIVNTPQNKTDITKPQTPSKTQNASSSTNTQTSNPAESKAIVVRKTNLTKEPQKSNTQSIVNTPQNKTDITKPQTPSKTQNASSSTNTQTSNPAESKAIVVRKTDLTKEPQKSHNQPTVNTPQNKTDITKPQTPSKTQNTSSSTNTPANNTAETRNITTKKPDNKRIIPKSIIEKPPNQQQILNKKFSPNTAPQEEEEEES